MSICGQAKGRFPPALAAPPTRSFSSWACVRGERGCYGRGGGGSGAMRVRGRPRSTCETAQASRTPRPPRQETIGEFVCEGTLPWLGRKSGLQGLRSAVLRMSRGARCVCGPLPRACAPRWSGYGAAVRRNQQPSGPRARPHARRACRACGSAGTARAPPPLICPPPCPLPHHPPAHPGARTATLLHMGRGLASAADECGVTRGLRVHPPPPNRPRHGNVLACCINLLLPKRPTRCLERGGGLVGAR